jgi:hypothetical protein
MTRKISLILGIAIAALAVAVPTAFGEGRLAGSQEPAQLPAVNTYRDAFERGAMRPSAIESALGEGPHQAYFRINAFERAHPSAGTAYVAVVSSGGGIEWPQIGVGFGVGILLALGLVLGMRHMRVRPLAH